MSGSLTAPLKSLSVQEEDFDVGAELKALTAGRTEVGAVCNFVGLVRDISGPDADHVSAMTLEHYPGMTEKQLSALIDKACERWPLSGCRIIHRYGRLLPGDQIVMVITTSRHREAAFESCHYLMDWLKTRAPFWKLEEDDQGQGNWVDAREEDDLARARWDKAAPSDKTQS
ncbi:molybdenum cofactor biosynthesis protein MoaE [Kiloniella sp. b19]|uniref:molybdenum cofactor biosynthesis protein MoaE n=1 Tax=Kiloniella sp. GXU_MW_B19 TaxID=3141326 RepID=UPI0031CE66A8